MHLIDWIIVAVGMFICAYIGLKAQKYVKGVSDFLTGGRVANRYMLAVSQAQAAVGLISLVAVFEAYYAAGFGYSFWEVVSIPLMMVLALTGYCIYRFRETRAMTMGQFFEIRYSKAFRISAATLQAMSGIINYGLFPAVGARFIIYFCDLPVSISIGGWVFPTFALLMAGFLGLAVLIATLGGQITIMATDCIQGILSYPMYVIVVFCIFWKFSFHQEMAPALLDRPVGQSMLNPYDIQGLRDFNLFYIMVVILGGLVNRMAWSGTQGFNAAAVNAHEQKMGGVLGTWRSGFQVLMYVLLPIAAFTFLHHAKYSVPAKQVRAELVRKAMNDVASGEKFARIRAEVEDYLRTGQVGSALQARLDERVKAEAIIKSRDTQQAQKIETTASDEPERDVAKQALASEDKSVAQTFETIFGQMRVPLSLRVILPTGVVGVFCAIMLFLMTSTDMAYMHSWGSIIVQDIILPFRKRPFTPRQQLLLLRLFLSGVGIFAFFLSYFFGQVDYILMFMIITGAIYVGGAGVCIVGGLYWKRGTTAGAWAALLSGSTLAVGGIFCQKYWVEYIYPWLVRDNMIDRVRRVVEGIADPFRPIIDWRVTGDKFPINSQEMFFITMLVSISLYVVISLLTCREPFNMERMLHRGKYRLEGQEPVKERLTIRTAFKQLIGITSEYTKGDRIIAWSVLIYSLGWVFGSWLVIIIWNAFQHWPNEWWASWFAIYYIYVAAVIGIISTVWFTIGGTLALRQMFKRLAIHQANILDDGRVVDHVSAADVNVVEKVEHVTFEEVHEAEQVLAEELKEEQKRKTEGKDDN